MYIKVFFKIKGTDRNGVRIPIDVSQKLLNGFIHGILGDNNPFHDKFSDYCISELQGMKLDKETRELCLDGDNNPYITVSTYKNQNFLRTLVDGLYSKDKAFGGLVLDKIEVFSHNVHKEWDIVVSTSPILLIVDGIKISIEDDGFVDHLKNHCVNKLKRNGIEDETFDVQIRRSDRAKKCLKYVGESWNICSRVSLYVTGKPSTREALYELGIGGSTGSGFGSVKLFS